MIDSVKVRSITILEGKLVRHFFHFFFLTSNAHNLKLVLESQEYFQAKTRKSTFWLRRQTKTLLACARRKSGSQGNKNCWIMSTLLGILAIVLFVMVSLAHSENYYKWQGPLPAEYRRKNAPANKLSSPQIQAQPRKGSQVVAQGQPQRFCTMFGCDCTPLLGRRCCEGYVYDNRANRCRELVRNK
ncbi:hypothetical protein NPIL_88831 [Nephila pilipes]|uniref:Uncharacterized protein n=1 Tax=Nephila pilipes TaxID=299642 RepID=A0A8X6TAN0_NEPPI|nr:hypothetical protein NPIL_88831 [Nephila pilipes]